MDLLVALQGAQIIGNLQANMIHGRAWQFVQHGLFVSDQPFTKDFAIIPGHIVWVRRSAQNGLRARRTARRQKQDGD
ncbi:MAG: hypothetical protein GY832_34155 [Chloroflexi bacterium]|nr:hypothetical protein [Chloroflexota bacterium]